MTPRIVPRSTKVKALICSSCTKVDVLSVKGGCGSSIAATGKSACCATHCHCGWYSAIALTIPFSLLKNLTVA
ncbi:Uncharacterised protein [Vibrio cholerae]|nr:Uncharacterised protein [Vibrio cholerae]CSB55541.1 Uncharacterised protein [Vibrio cholerae]CSC18251.1 Uncharacterised protein [Vibrio cholerae]CSC21520.1 Uncharacterised protein [Vibrio cholerae]CSC44424.1 Uncharacterised protein [Vibrio cholerae]